MKLPDVAEEVLKTAEGVVAINWKVLYGMAARLRACGSTALKDGFMFPGSGFQEVVFKEWDGEERDVIQCFYHADIQAQMVDVAPVNRVVSGLKMKQL